MSTFTFGRAPVTVPDEPGLTYEELLDRIKHGTPPRPKQYRVKSHGPVTVEQVALHGYGRKARNLGPRTMQRGGVR